jgi:NAD(P)-dependent dehydrogenase (short-subunit alcohol dehydrogenase family)
MEQLAGRVAVVTGAGSGIGRGIAATLAAAGSHVMSADIDAAAARETAAQLAGAGVEVVPVECDVTDREAVEALASNAWAHFGHVDIAVNDAGVIPPIRRAINIDERDARWVLEVNLMGAWLGLSDVLRQELPDFIGLDPADIGRAAVEGIRRGDFYIVTHPPVREIVAERAAEIMAAFDVQAPRYQGDEAIDTRAVMARPRTSAEGRS